MNRIRAGTEDITASRKKAELEEYKLQWIDYKTAIETFLGDADNPVQVTSDADDSASGTDNENQENLGGNEDE